MRSVLEGVRVIDWTIFHAGPAAGEMLGDLGAEVIKIEQPGGGDPARSMLRGFGSKVASHSMFENYNHNKKSITLNLGKEQGKLVLYRLISKSDVFIQNMRQGVAEKLGVDYRALASHNPRLIYGNLTGLGPKGAESSEPLIDTMALARSGIMTLVGEPGQPPCDIPRGIADRIGGIMLAYAILAALLARERFGIGQEVHASLLGAMIALQTASVSQVLAGGEVQRQSRQSMSNPLINTYQCGDGKWLTLGFMQSDRYWPEFCQTLGLEVLEKDSRFANAEQREKNSEQLIALLDKAFASRPRSDWLQRLGSRSLPCGPVQTVESLLCDPQVLENDYIVEVPHAGGTKRVIGMPFELTRTPGCVHLPPPELGQHTEEVLREIGGYTSQEIRSLKSEGVF